MLPRFAQFPLILAGALVLLTESGCYSSRGSSSAATGRYSAAAASPQVGSYGSVPQTGNPGIGEYPTFRGPREPAPVYGSDGSPFQPIPQRAPNGRSGPALPETPPALPSDDDDDDGDMSTNAIPSKTFQQKFADFWRGTTAGKRPVATAADQKPPAARPVGTAQIRRVTRPDEKQMAQKRPAGSNSGTGRAAETRIVKLVPPPETYVFEDEPSQPQRLPLPIDGRQVAASAQFAARSASRPVPAMPPVETAPLDPGYTASRSVNDVPQQVPDWTEGSVKGQLRAAAPENGPVRVVDPPRLQTPPAGQELDSRSSATGVLAIPRIAICSQVRGFGNIVEYDVRKLRQGQQIVIYATLENFRSIATSKGYRTLTLSTLEVRKATGEVLKRQPLGTAVDLAEMPRRDFYLTHLVSVPEDLPAGDYVFGLFVDDLLGHESARTEIAVRVTEGRSRRDGTADTSESATRPAGFRR